MKAFLMVVACSMIVMAASVRAAEGSAAAPTTKPSLEEENRALRSQVEAQRDQILKLSKELRERESEVAQLKSKQRLSTWQPAYPLVPAPQVPQAQPFSLVPSVPAIPPGAVPHQFNGSTYYVVPLKTVENRVEGPVAPTPDPTIGTIDDRSGGARELIHGK